MIATSTTISLPAGETEGVGHRTFHVVVFHERNGGTGGVKVFNAAMRGSKARRGLGGTRAASFWRLARMFRPPDVDMLTAHVDVFPTLAELAGGELSVI